MTNTTETINVVFQGSETVKRAALLLGHGYRVLGATSNASQAGEVNIVVSGPEPTYPPGLDVIVPATVVIVAFSERNTEYEVEIEALHSSGMTGSPYRVYLGETYGLFVDNPNGPGGIPELL